MKMDSTDPNLQSPNVAEPEKSFAETAMKLGVPLVIVDGHKTTIGNRLDRPHHPGIVCDSLHAAINALLQGDPVGKPLAITAVRHCHIA